MFRLVTSALDTDTQVRFPNTNGDRAEHQAFLYRPVADMASQRQDIHHAFWRYPEQSQRSSCILPGSTERDSPTNTLLGDPGFTRYSTNQASFSYKLEHHFNETWTVRQNFRFQRQDGKFQGYKPAGFDPTTETDLLRMGASLASVCHQGATGSNRPGYALAGPT